jgi:hypothetical protein
LSDHDCNIAVPHRYQVLSRKFSPGNIVNRDARTARIRYT